MTSFPYEIKMSEANEELIKDFTGHVKGYLEVGPEKYILPYPYKYHAENYYNFKVRKDDIWIVTFPRSGTTWTQEMAWLLSNDLNYEKAQKIVLTERFPFFEFNAFFSDETVNMCLQNSGDNQEKIALVNTLTTPGNEHLDSIASPRFIKTHLPFSLLPPNLLDSGCKVIYVARNPKDVAISYFHLNRLVKSQGFIGDFKKFWYYFQNNLVSWSPFWSHLKEGWENRHKKNFLFMFYEDINKDLLGAIKKMNKFLGKNYDDEEMNKLAEYLHISNFRKNKAVNFSVLNKIGLLKEGEQEFIRRGANGSWRDEFPPELNAQADKWIEENLAKTDLRFPNY